MEGEPNKAYFCEVDSEGVIADNLREAYLFFKVLGQIGTELSEQEGYTIYPFVRLDYEPGSS